MAEYIEVPPRSVQDQLFVVLSVCLLALGASIHTFPHEVFLELMGSFSDHATVDDSQHPYVSPGVKRCQVELKQRFLFSNAHCP